MSAQLHLMQDEAYPPALINVAAEAGLVGAMLCESRLVEFVADQLTESDFHEGVIGAMFAVIVREHSLGRSMNPVTLRPFLEGDPRFAELGGFSWLVGLTERTNIVGARGFAQQIADLAARRRLHDGLRETLARATDLSVTIPELAGEAEEAIAAAVDRQSDRSEVTAGECARMVIDGMDEPVGGVLCRVIPSVDNLLGPIRPSHLVIGAGRPGMRKTTTALSYGKGAAAQGHGVIYFSLEMASVELGERLLADECLEQRVPYQAIKDRTLDMMQRRDICRAAERLQNLPLVIVDKSAMTIGQLRADVRRWRRRFEAKGTRLDLVIVDYLQLMRGERRMERIEVVSEISRGLKAIAKEERLGVLALSQLNRSVDNRADHRPMLSDLRESGQIEQDADAVLFFLRDEVYLKQAGEPTFGDPEYDDWQKKLDICQGRIEFICGKRRNGVVGSRIAEFLGPYQAVRG